VVVFDTHTSPAESIAIPSGPRVPPPVKPVGGEIGHPVSLALGGLGQLTGGEMPPTSSVILFPEILATQTLPAPSIAIPSGPLSPPPLYPASGEMGHPVSLAGGGLAGQTNGLGGVAPPTSAVTLSNFELVTQTFPLLSIAMPSGPSKRLTPGVGYPKIGEMGHPVSLELGGMEGLGQLAGGTGGVAPPTSSLTSLNSSAIQTCPAISSVARSRQAC
jgi:hypothetical protein